MSEAEKPTHAERILLRAQKTQKISARNAEKVYEYVQQLECERINLYAQLAVVK